MEQETQLWLELHMLQSRYVNALGSDRLEAWPDFFVDDCLYEIVPREVVDHECRTSDPDIFAAGEVTRHFVSSVGRHMRVESWQVAEKQPAVAAANMLGATERYDETPWLWSDQYNCNVQSLGTFEDTHKVVLRGAISDGGSSMIGLNHAGNVRAAVTVNNGKDMAIFVRMVAGGPVDANQLADTSVSFRSLLKR